MKAQCKTCGKNCEGEYCFRHKPRKKLATTKKDNSQKTSEMQEFFLKIWKKRLHYSQVSMDYLGKEPLTIFFHHILPKEKYPQAMYDEENIVLVTLEEHDNVERDMYKYDVINKMRENLLKKYE
jgi:hypothetical protein